MTDKGLLNKDYYGNEQQNPTPTTRLFAERNKAKIEGCAKYKNNTLVWRAVSVKVLIGKLQMIIADLEDQPEKKFKFSLEIEEE
jgi:hypothetical protein